MSVRGTSMILMGSSYLQTAANLTAGVSGLSILEMRPNDASPELIRARRQTADAGTRAAPVS